MTAWVLVGVKIGVMVWVFATKRLLLLTLSGQHRNDISNLIVKIALYLRFGHRRER